MNKKKREYDRTIKIAVVFTFLYIEIISCFSLNKTKRAEIERVEFETGKQQFFPSFLFDK